MIEDDVWIGSKITILDGAAIGPSAVVGARAIVNRSIPLYAIAVGALVTVIGMWGK